MSRPFDLGFLGGGQLARMSIQAAQRMGLRCLSLDPGEDTPASQIAASLVGRLDDPTKIAEVLSRASFVTLENEFIPSDAVRAALASGGRLTPGVNALATIQDKLLQRQALAAAGVPTPLAVALEPDPASAIETIGFPMVLKARFGGYDGKGTRYARTPEELDSHQALWEPGGWLAESFVPFQRELAAMVFVEASGSVGCFPTVETIQENHVCSVVRPASSDASSVAIAAVRAISGSGAGLFGVEMFELADGSIQINELAPRPHNTGHYTLDWGGLSQFDVHVRVACGFPVGPLEGRHDVCMVNLLGQPGAGSVEAARRTLLDAHPWARFHWYGKAEAKPGRKMGHINVVRGSGETVEELTVRANRARDTFYSAWN